MIPQKLYDKIYNTVPRICVDLIIKNKHGVLLAKRTSAPYKGKWAIPGGGVKFGEAVNKSLNRLSLDEIGVNVCVGKHIGWIEFFNERVSGKKRHAVSIVFLCIPKGKPVGTYFKVAPKNIHPGHLQFLINNKLIK